MARWVFRPFAQFRRAICTSAPNQEHPPVFPLASLLSSKDRHLSGLSMHALHAVSFLKKPAHGDEKREFLTPFLFPLKKNHFHYALWDFLFPIGLACMLISLVRVSRRDELVHHWIQHYFSDSPSVQHIRKAPISLFPPKEPQLQSEQVQS